MKSIFLLFWRICIFQSGPDAVPASHTLTIIIILLNAVVNIAVQLLIGADQLDLLRASTLAVVSLAGTGALVWFVMALMGLVNRVQQTVTAVFGTDVLMTVLTAIAFAATGSISENVAMFAITLLTLWSLMVYGFIFHRAMNIHIGFGIAIALFVVIFSVAITQTALGGP
jgi:hypothetical protein